LGDNQKSWADLPYEKWAKRSSRGNAPLVPQPEITAPTIPVIKREANTRCPDCGQHHLRRAKMIYESGTRSGSGTSGNYITSYSSQTALAASNSPPPEPYGRLAFWVLTFAGLAILCIALLLTMKTFIFEYKMTILGGLVGLIVGISNSAGHKRRIMAWAAAKEQWARDYAEWEDTWTCMDCGSHFILRS